MIVAECIDSVSTSRRSVPILRVRIQATPYEQELDGIRLDGLRPGMVRDVWPTIGLWLVAQGYAVPEMRANSRDEDLEFTGLKAHRDVASDRHRRRSTDR
jgi:hypothetical protein